MSNTSGPSCSRTKKMFKKMSEQQQKMQNTDLTELWSRPLDFNDFGAVFDRNNEYKNSFRFIQSYDLSNLTNSNYCTQILTSKMLCNEVLCPSEDETTDREIIINDNVDIFQDSDDSRDKDYIPNSDENSSDEEIFPAKKMITKYSAQHIEKTETTHLKETEIELNGPKKTKCLRDKFEQENKENIQLPSREITPKVSEKDLIKINTLGEQNSILLEEEIQLIRQDVLTPGDYSDQSKQHENYRNNIKDTKRSTQLENYETDGRVQQKDDLVETDTDRSIKQNDDLKKTDDTDGLTQQQKDLKETEDTEQPTLQKDDPMETDTDRLIQHKDRIIEIEDTDERKQQEDDLKETEETDGPKQKKIT